MARSQAKRSTQMFKRKTSPIDTARTFLGALRRDARGNTMAILAAALIPLAGMVGGGIDISRMYIVKTRLQHACDAGALAGRKQMGAGSWGTDDNAAATRFFDANFQSDAYGITSRSRIFTENAGRVTGSASANLPMTLTRIIGRNAETLTVTCDAEMKLPNTDVMFVLDTTGSMNCVAGDLTCTNNGGVPASGSKIDGLKTAVKCFYEILAQLDTNANCTTGTPSGGTSSAVQIRFGFMPYASNVNVGYLLPSNYFANSWSFPSRARNGNNSAWSDWNSDTDYNNPNSYGNCNAPNNTSTKQYQYDQKIIYKGTVYCAYNSRFYGPQWTYGPTSINFSNLKSGTGWNHSFTLNINDDGSAKTITWDGCIEERPTVAQTNYSPIPATAYDLNIDLIPTSSDTNSLWGPALNDVIYYRNILTDTSQATTATSNSANNYYNNVSYSCPTEAKKLQAWPSAGNFEAYVDSLTASGNTYHDIGMLWGARFMSPTGIFQSENALAANGGQIQRHMIFMTDGDSTSSPCDFNAYGVPWYDRKQTTAVGTADNCFSNRQELIDQINYRLDALCTAVKGKGITLWVVSYGGTGIKPATKTRLQTCASPADSVAPTHYFDADDPDKLQQAFATIANNISQLRLTR